MSMTVDIRDEASAALRAMVQRAGGRNVNAVIGRSAVNLVQSHFRELEQSRANKLGGKRTHFYAQAARGTHFVQLADGVMVGINQVGIRQRYLGGTIKAGKNISRVSGKPTKYLTIPARAEAYGRRAGEFSNLTFAMTERGPALVEAQSASLKKGKKGFKGAGETGGAVYYWLVPQVTQQGDRTILPTNQALSEHVAKDIASFLGLRS